MEDFLGDVLSHYTEERGQTAGRLHKMTGIPKQTIASWLEGRVKRPRNMADILRVAKALRLTIVEADHLLASARYDSIQVQLRKAAEVDNEEMLNILEFWQAKEYVASPPSRPAPFQAMSAIGDFVGRESEIRTITNALQTSGAICILQGMGGVGKTTLANQLAYQLRSAFPDGVLWAELNDMPLSDERVMTHLRDFARAYGVDVREDLDLESRSRTVRDLLSGKQALMILDGAHGTKAVHRLLPPSTGKCAVLITTRNKKMLGDRAHSFEIRSFDEEDSLALLRSVVNCERIDEEETGARKIVDFVGGLPLALRVVGSALVEAEYLTLMEYCELLRDERSRLEHLADWEDVSKNVRASFELSFGRLAPALQTMLSKLGIFVGHEFSAEAVAALTETPLALVKKNMGRFQALSLLEFSDTEHMRLATPYHARYHFHPLLRTFVREKLGEAPLAQKARLAVYYAQFAQSHGRHAHEVLDGDWENVQAAVNWAHENKWEATLVQSTEGLTQFDVGIAGFLDTRGYWREAQQWLAWSLATPLVEHDALRAAFCHLKRGTFAFHLAERDTAQQSLGQALELIVAAPLQEQVVICRAYACELLAQLALKSGLEEALDWSERGMVDLKEIDTPETRQLLGYMLVRQSTILGRIGDLDAAHYTIEQGLQLLPTRPTVARASGYTNLGNIAYFKGDHDEAERHWQTAITDTEQLGDNRRTADLRQNLGTLFSSSGDFKQSVEFYDKAIDVYRRMGNMAGECRALSNSADDLRKIGRELEATARLDAAIVKAHQHQLDEEIYALFNRARLQVYTAQLSTAAVDLDRAEQLSRQRRFMRWMGMITTVRAEIALLNQDAEAAQSFITRALQAGLDDEEKGVALRVQGDILISLGQYRAAMAAYEESSSTLKDTNRFEHTRTQVARAQLSQEQNALAATKAELTAALQAFQEMNATYEIHRVQTLLAAIGHDSLKSPPAD